MNVKLLKKKKKQKRQQQKLKNCTSLPKLSSGVFFVLCFKLCRFLNIFSTSFEQSFEQFSAIFIFSYVILIISFSFSFSLSLSAFLVYSCMRWHFFDYCSWSVASGGSSIPQSFIFCHLILAFSLFLLQTASYFALSRSRVSLTM